MNGLRAPALVLLLCALLGLLLFQSNKVVALDFRAFYCAGVAMRAHADPYRTASLQDCETKTDWQFTSHVGKAALPAPYPGYDIALFAVFAALPYDLAKSLWGALLGVAAGITVLALTRLSKLSPALILCALSTTLIGPSLALGQIVPIYMAALCCAMLLAREQRYTAACIAALVTLLEPHLGLPICISLAVWAPRTRVPLAIGAGVLGCVSLVPLGIAQSVEYVSVVLPLHALSELPSDGQLSFSVVLHGLGFSDSQALAGGSLSYGFMAVLGVALARTAARRFSDRSFLVAVPAAAAVVGGSFLHGTDVVAALPLTLLLLVHAPKYRALFSVALVLLVTPWWAALDDSRSLAAWFAFSAIAAFYLIWQLNDKRVLSATASALVIAVALFGLSRSYNAARTTFMNERHSISVGIDRRYPQASWAQAVRQTFSTESVPAWLIRTPTWAGLLLVMGGIGAARPKYVTAP